MRGNKWTEDELSFLINNWQTMLGSQLAEQLPRHSRDCIYKKLRSLGFYLYKNDGYWRHAVARSKINNDLICKTDQSIDFNDLNNEVVQVLLGSMLGDGCSTKQSANLRNYRFVEGHSLKQREYLEWKSRFLSLFKPRIVLRESKIDLITKTHPIFTIFRSKFYPSLGKCSKSVLPLDLLEKLDLFGFMIWYLDDGNLGKKSWNLNIGAKGWEEDGLNKLVEVINKKFNISAYVYKCRHYKGENKVVKIPFKDKTILEKWLNLAKNYNLPQCMYYKLGV